MTQIIFNKVYKRMYEQKRIGITIGTKVNKLAEINQAEVIEGMSDFDFSDEEEQVQNDSNMGLLHE